MYLYGSEFELVKDHKAFGVLSDTTSRPCARLERWVLDLQSCKFQKSYKLGSTNIADPLY